MEQYIALINANVVDFLIAVKKVDTHFELRYNSIAKIDWQRKNITDTAIVSTGNSDNSRGHHRYSLATASDSDINKPAYSNKL